VLASYSSVRKSAFRIKTGETEKDIEQKIEMGLAAQMFIGSPQSAREPRGLSEHGLFRNE
jgi:hypothetical protein